MYRYLDIYVFDIHKIWSINKPLWWRRDVYISLSLFRAVRCSDINNISLVIHRPCLHEETRLITAYHIIWLYVTISHRSTIWKKSMCCVIVTISGWILIMCLCDNYVLSSDLLSLQCVLFCVGAQGLIHHLLETHIQWRLKQIHFEHAIICLLCKVSGPALSVWEPANSVKNREKR